MSLTYFHNTLVTIWTVFWVAWILPAVFGKRTIRRQSSGSRILQIVLLVVAYVLIVNGRLGWDLLNLRVVPAGAASLWSGYGLLMAGMLFAGWARIFLGGNWSSSVTLKQDHTLIRSGPYRIVRHPIYTGLLVALLGTAIVLGELRCFIGVILAAVAWKMKSINEEALMVEEFGDQYTRYRLQVKGLVPDLGEGRTSAGILHPTTRPISRKPLNCPKNEEKAMATATVPAEKTITRKELIAALNEDLAREYQAIIAYVNYSQVLKGAAYMNIAAELEVHATEELQHAITLANQIDYLGGMPVVVPKPVKTSEKAEEMLRFDLATKMIVPQLSEEDSRVRPLGEYATAEYIREILLQEQDHQISLATALGIDVPDLSEPSASSQE